MSERHKQRSNKKTVRSFSLMDILNLLAANFACCGYSSKMHGHKFVATVKQKRSSLNFHAPHMTESDVLCSGSRDDLFSINNPTVKKYTFKINQMIKSVFENTTPLKIKCKKRKNENNEKKERQK